MPDIFESLRAAPAKINLFLRVLNKRDDGFHNVETLFQTISLADTVRVRCSAGDCVTTVSYVGSDLHFGEKDLAFRAAQAYRQLCPQLQAVTIEIDKRIPIGAGLAGGSSDAAAVLRALQEYAPVDTQKLQEIACELGSDVPFFLVGGTVYASGRGEVCIALDDAQGGDVFLLTPKQGNNTAAIFSLMTDEDKLSADADLAECCQKPDFMWQDHMQNNMTRAARAHNPLLNDLCQQLEKRAQPWLMSGSGSSCFVCSDTVPVLDADVMPISFRRRNNLDTI